MIDFNQIDPKIEQETIALLKSFHHTYHKKSWVYRRLAKRKAKVKLNIYMVSIALTGSAVAKTIVAPISVSITAMSAILIQAYLARTKINSYIENSKLANAIYDQVLNQLKGYRRGLVFDEKILLSDLRAVDNIVSYISPPMSGRFVKK